MDTTRFARVIPASNTATHSVFILGCGGIGSFTADIVARMGFREITLCDFDSIETPNVATQHYDLTDVGLRKVTTTGARIAAINPHINITGIYRRVDIEHPLTDVPPHTIIIAATDNIESRRALHHHWLNGLGDNPSLFIDPRMGLEEFELYTNQRTRHDPPSASYAAFLNDTAQTFTPLPCGAQAIAYTGSFAAAIIGSVIRRYVTGEPVPSNIHADLHRFEITSNYRKVSHAQAQTG